MLNDMLKNSLKNTLLLSLLILALFNSCTKENATSSNVSLTSFGPSGVAHGETIKFIGTNLNQVTSIVLPVDVEIPASSFTTQTSTLIELVVPDASTTGYVTLKTPQGDVVSKTAFGSSYIISVTSFTPATATPGTNITIAGNFLNYVKQVTFSDNLKVTQFVSQSINQLVVQVPLAAKTGGISLTDLAKTPSVVDQDAAGNTLVLNVSLPAVTSLSPSSIEQTKNLTIAGTNLDLVNEIDFTGGGKVMTPFVSQSAAQIVVAVPNTAVTGTLTLTALSGVKTVTSQSITVLEPSITTVPVGRNGANITITGTNLNLVASILFPDGGVGTSVASSSFTNVATDGTSFTVAIPASAIPGTLKLVTIHSFTVTVASPSFNITLPAATSYSTGVPGASMTIAGTDLDLVKGIVFPNATTGITVTSFTSQSPTSIVVTIPASAGSGSLIFLLANGYKVAQPLAFGGACVTNFPGGSVLYNFNTSVQGWGGGTYQAPAGLVTAFAAAEGHSCLGAAQLTIPFATYGQNADIEINPGPPMDFTGKSKLHFWAKVTVAGGATAGIAAIQFYVNTGGYSKYSGNYINLTQTLSDGGSFSDGNWHEGVYNIAANTANIVVGVINQFGVQIVTPGSAPGGGPASPPTVVLVVDDVWLE
jgi:hypothetical protein